MVEPFPKLNYERLDTNDLLPSMSRFQVLHGTDMEQPGVTVLKSSFHNESFLNTLYKKE